jgi:hypothetical protein
MTGSEFLILEFDPSIPAKIEPSQVNDRKDVPEHCVITFFHEVVDKVAKDAPAKIAVENRWTDHSRRAT